MVNEVSLNVGSIDNVNSPYIGALHSNYSEGSLVDAEWDGMIDDVFVIDRAISDEEIQSVYNDSSNLTNISNLSGYWNFNEGDEQILHDLSSNTNHGNIHGATWVGSIEGCTDELACNYDETAVISDDSCNYNCHDNGDYSLSFDGDGSSVIDLLNFEFEEVDSITFSLDFNLDNFIYQSDHNHIFDFEGQNIRYTLVAGLDYIEMRFEGYNISHRFEATPLDSKWYNIIIQSTSNTLNIIYDGSLVVSETWLEPLVSHGYTS